MPKGVALLEINAASSALPWPGRERTGLDATTVYVHADDAERLADCGLTVVVDRAMLKGHLGVGRES